MLIQPHLVLDYRYTSSESQPILPLNRSNPSPRLHHPVLQTRPRSTPRTTCLNDPEISPPLDVTANSQPHQTPTHTGTPHSSVHPRTSGGIQRYPLSWLKPLEHHPYTALKRRIAIPKRVRGAILSIARGTCYSKPNPTFQSQTNTLNVTHKRENKNPESKKDDNGTQLWRSFTSCPLIAYNSSIAEGVSKDVATLVA